MTARRRYKKKAGTAVIAIQVQLETDGFTYRKWGGIQTCKPGDWLVDNGGDIYTVDSEVFVKTYKSVGRGLYVKIKPVWAEIATTSGTVVTKEGTSDYKPGDFLVFNNHDGTDPYCMSATKFESMYELDE